MQKEQLSNKSPIAGMRSRTPWVLTADSQALRERELVLSNTKRGSAGVARKVPYPVSGDVESLRKGELKCEQTHFSGAMTPDFYLSTAAEYGGLAVPRACQIEARLSDKVRNDHLLVRIDPPLVGQGFGLGSRDIEQLVLTAIFEGSALCPINAWPAHVYVARILDESIVTTRTINSGQVQVIAWGMLSRTLAEATASIRKPQR